MSGPGGSFSLIQKTSGGPTKPWPPASQAPPPRPSPPPPSPLHTPHSRLLLFVKWKPSGSRTAAAGGPGVPAVPAGVISTPVSSGPAAGLGCSCPAGGAAAQPGHLRACLQLEEPAWHHGGCQRVPSPTHPGRAPLRRLLPGTTCLPSCPLQGHRRRIVGTRPSPGSCAFPHPPCCPL